MFERLAIVGVGLLGGSVGLAARRRFPGMAIVGIDHDRRQLDAGLRCGAFDAGYSSLDAASVGNADFVVLAMPVDAIAAAPPMLEKVLRGDAIVTDVGSTKRRIASAFDSSSELRRRFVGAHPMAGSEKSGCEHASADLFDNAPCALTPRESVDPRTIAAVEEFWIGLGCRVMRMTPDVHDRAVAFSSHLPHLVAMALAATAGAESRGLIGPGFRTMTRLARGNQRIWNPILSQNSDHVAVALERFSDRIRDLARGVNAGDWSGIYDFGHELQGDV